MSTDRTAADRLSTASEVARGIRNGHLSARDVVERQLDRIARFNPALNAVVTLDADGARRRAREADRALARSVEDLKIALPIISEPGTPPLVSAIRPVTSELRLAWTDDFGGTPLDHDSRRLMQQLADALAHRGARIECCANAHVDYDEAVVVTIPIGSSPDGLPIGIQVVGKRWREKALLDVASEISSAAGGYRSPPGY